MRRADRLFQIIQSLRRRRGVTTAALLAQRLEVSERTIYRDIADLIANGTPIDGEAGVGYRLRAEYDLPPLMFDHDEIQALVLGARVVGQFGDAGLAKASASVLAKVSAVLPKELNDSLAQTPLFAPGRLAFSTQVTAVLATVREALEEKHKLRLSYRDERDRRSKRVVRPVGAFLWSRVWTLAAWCELRKDFRNFRLDRIEICLVLDETFRDEPGRTLKDFLAQCRADSAKLLME
jgi:predicted DNA-binding transcriptional regulator YafY